MKIVKSLIIFLLGFFLVVSGVFSQEFPEPVGYVNDFGQLLSPPFVQELEIDLQNFEKETSAEVAVVTVENLGGSYLEDYAVKLFEQWGIGKEQEDNGLLILIAEQEREIRIEVGYGLEPVITDARAGRIIREEMAPHFKNEDYDAGVKAAVVQVQAYIRAGESPAGLEQARESSSESFSWLIVGFIIFIYLTSFWARSKRIWPGGVVGSVLGGTLGVIKGSLGSFFSLAIGLGALGLFLDWLFSKNYETLKSAKKPTGFWSSRGGFWSGGSSSGGGGGFGGFSGGSSGGGGASGGW